MAEAFLRAWGGDRFEAHSAGTEVTRVRPEAVAVMDELGIDMRGQESKSVERYLGRRFDWVITVCDQARENCPVFPGAERTGHWGFEDPSRAEGSEEERLQVFRRVRDEIARRLRIFLLAAERDDLPEPSPTELDG